MSIQTKTALALLEYASSRQGVNCKNYNSTQPEKRKFK
jgi:hypothetical protein